MFSVKIIIQFNSFCFIILPLISAIEFQSICGDWKPYKEEKCFKLFENFKIQSYDNANWLCGEKEMNSSLVTIHSEEEQQFIENYIFQHKNIVDNVWIGAKRANHSSAFKWFDGNDLSYDNWASGYPTNELNHNCIQMSTVENSFGNWSDERCYVGNLVLCQKPQMSPLVVLYNLFSKINLEMKLDFEVKIKLLSKENKRLDKTNEFLKMELLRQNLRINEIENQPEKTHHINGTFEKIPHLKYENIENNISKQNTRIVETVEKLEKISDFHSKIFFGHNIRHYKLFSDSDNNRKALIVLYSGQGRGYTWDTAQSLCNDYSGSLVSIESFFKQQIVQSLLVQLDYESSGFWTSGARGNDGKWRWTNNGNEFTYTNWREGYPKKDDYHVIIFKNRADSNSNIHLQWTGKENDRAFQVVCEVTLHI